MTDAKILPMIIVVGPSGVGKSSFVDKITAEIPSIKDIVTYTTRPMRTGEVDGTHYHFVQETRFKALIEDNFFVEWANVHGKMYGFYTEKFVHIYLWSKNIYIYINSR